MNTGNWCIYRPYSSSIYLCGANIAIFHRFRDSYNRNCDLYHTIVEQEAQLSPRQLWLRKLALAYIARRFRAWIVSFVIRVGRTC